MSNQVRVVSVEAAPLQGVASAIEASGAFANIYLLAQSDDAAVKQAMREMSDVGWGIVGTPEIRLVDSESFTDDGDGLKYYEQCLIDGVVVVLHTWRDEH